ncbi:MAG: MATE family efflux transporter [Oscillospiraceae bacterium]|nr:MATE family efflux transporter [Oscillospiraceae bacterium]
MKMENDLGRDKVSKLVLRIAIPSMLAQFVSVCYSIVDRMFVGNIPGVGDVSLAGVGICGPIVTMIGAFAYLVGIGGTPLMGISLGERNKERASRIMANCFLLLCLTAILITAVVIPLREPMLRLFGASDVTYPYAEKYFVIYISGTIFALLASGMNQFIICQGYAKVGMFSVMIGAVMNIALDPVFIYLLDMGVSGAALATIISQAVSVAFVLRFLLSDKVDVRLTFGKLDGTIVKRVLQLGFAPFAIIALDNVMIIAMNALLQKYGGAQGDALITCNTIVQSFMLVMTMPLGGISGGTQSILSYNYGACRSDRVLLAQKYIMGLCALYTGLLFVLARVAGPLFASLFTSDPELNAQACRAIRICTIGAIPLGIQYAIIDGFTGMGQVQLSLPLSLWRKAVYFVSIFVLPAIFGAEAVFYAETISDFVGPVVSVAVYLLTIRRILRKREMG